MKRVNLNFGIDLAAFFALLMLISTGLLMEFRLPPGTGGHEPYGHGWRALERPTPVIWDMTRHQWGEIHFWIAVTFSLLLAFHLVLHWKWIVATIKNLAPRTSKSTLLLWLIGIVGALLIAAPLVSPKFERKHNRPSATASEAQTPAGTSIGNIEPVSTRLR
jgi:hypothetical protein